MQRWSPLLMNDGRFYFLKALNKLLVAATRVQLHNIFLEHSIHRCLYSGLNIRIFVSSGWFVSKGLTYLRTRDLPFGATSILAQSFCLRFVCWNFNKFFLFVCLFWVLPTTNDSYQLETFLGKASITTEYFR